MQTLNQIKELLSRAGASPAHKFGQCFMIDKNLLSMIVNLADIQSGDTVVEIGPGTGTLTEELIERAGRVVAVEIDHALANLLEDYFAGKPNFTLIRGDVLAGKHKLNPDLVNSLKPGAKMVANLPYNIATPLVAECMIHSYKAQVERDDNFVFFNEMTFTVQSEVADRFIADSGTSDYGPVSVLGAITGNFITGPALPPGAFWPAPKVKSRALKYVFDPQKAAELKSVDTLMDILRLVFTQRRKKITALIKRKDLPWNPAVVAEGFEKAGISGDLRPDNISAGQYRLLANHLFANC